MTSQMSVEDFASKARVFLEANAERKEVKKKFTWGEGTDNVSMFEERSRDAEMEMLSKAKEWQAKRFDNGFGWITGPTEYGGAGLSNAHERAYNQVEREYRTAPLGVFQIGLGMVAPTILAHASDVAKEKYIRAMWRADIVGCQLFSEPGAGSDLASVQAKAERDGDEWLITGQKVWTSGAQFSDIGEIICRTDPSLPKHKGLTGFIVDMRAPGVEIRPLRQMTGGASFNEVFFNEVRVRDDHRLGEVNNGWNVALTTLMNERASIGSSDGGENNMYTRLLAMIRHYELDKDPIVRDMLADLYINTRVAGFTSQRATDKMRAGQLPGPEMSIGKMALVDNQKRMNDLVAHVLGAKLVVDTGEWGTYAWSQLLLGAPGMRIAGGSDEVMRNIVGERVLGLPKDVGIDSKSAFRDIKVGTQKD
ncbi:MAG: acyl-CoA dehydrogenase family protein [Actinobacteria bacterium]|nr:acyl-CoA dehydrogenase family protein [Actinomycetota bacterium]